MARNRDQGADIMFIQARFQELAAAAWQGYEMAGPGFLLIRCEDKAMFPAMKNAFDLQGSLVSGTLTAYYIAGEAVSTLGIEYPTPNTESMVESYDAEREIVVIIQRQDADGWSGYRYVGYAKPSTLFRKMQNSLRLTETQLDATWTEGPQQLTGYGVLPV